MTKKTGKGYLPGKRPAHGGSQDRMISYDDGCSWTDHEVYQTLSGGRTAWSSWKETRWIIHDFINRQAEPISLQEFREEY